MSDETKVAEQSPAERVMQLEGESREKWLETGKLPEPEVKTESDSSTDATPAKEAAVETPKIEQEKPRKQSRTDKRIAELLNDKKRLEAQLAEKSGTKNVDDVSVKESATEKKPEKVEAAKKPELKEFQTYEDWVEAVSDWKADQKITARLEEDRKQRETASKQTEIETKNKEIEKTWMDRVNKAKERHSDYEDVAFNKENTANIKPGTVLDGWILDSEFGAEILYELASDPEEIVRLNSLGPFAQARELAKLESSFSGKSPAASKVKIITSAPKPPSEVGGTGTVSDDPVESALARGNFRSYAEEMNRRELKSRKG